MMDEANERSFECEYCGKCFSLLLYRRRHINRIHKKKSINRVHKEKSFVCESCGKQFNYKFSLKRHMDADHFPQERFSCDVCNYTTTRKDTLKAHTNKVHSVKTTKVKNFKCSYCSSEFTYKNNILLHERRKHQIQRSTKPNFNRRCPLCEFTSTSHKRKEINDHFENEHGLKMEWQKHTFRNEAEFNDWKMDIENKDNVHFVKRKQFPSSPCFRYVCHRSGKFRPKPIATNKRQRRLKEGGSCRIDAHCPCEIAAKTKEDGQITVNYLPTHVGHKNDLIHLRLRTEDIKVMAEAENIPSMSPGNESEKEEVTKVEMSVSNIDPKRRQILRRRHKAAIVNYTDKDVVSIEDNKWRLNSLNNRQLYTVTKIKDCKDCPLRCVHCNSCFHEYFCSCAKKSIKTNMCIHMHAVASKVQRTIPMATDDCNVNVNVSSPFTIDEGMHYFSDDSSDKVKEKKEEMMDIFKMIVEEAKTEEQINFATTELKSIYQAVKGMTTEAGQSIQILDLGAVAVEICVSSDV